MRRVAIYGGTFDPVHQAHLILARDASEQLELDEVIFVPAAVSPHKLDQRSTSAALRWEMLQVAVAGEPRFRIDDCELRRPAPSFAIETVESLARTHADTQMFYLLGSDHLPRIETWRRIDDLRRLVRFAVLDRGNSVPKGDYEIIRRSIDISSTEVRNRVATGRSIRYLVPAAVEEIIRREHLYKDPTTSLPKS